MYLSGLEIIGFKSFPLKTSVEFANGITGVVGPNGCGKTNVLDAIRWVLGEQRISILRGGKMEDVIFAGTREMKPIGMAEVSLHIVNNRGVLPTEYNHLTLTRRLYRSGESEYLLNNVVCRLKDITELFADTGMGSHAYSAIELDMVEAILSDKADQRRMLFEEAAGITKYKQRKKAALRKLEATEHDLLRLSDILAEVSSQVSGLSRQMKRAERYKSLEERIRTAGQVLLKERYRRLNQQLDHVRDEKRVSQIKLAELSGEIDKWDLAREEYAAQALELGEQLRQLRERSESVGTDCHRLETEISVNDERIKAAAISDDSDRREIESIRGKLDQLAAEKSGLTDRLAAQRQLLASVNAELAEVEQRLTAKFAELDTARRSSQTHQRDLFEIEGQRSIKEQSRLQLEQQITELDETQARNREKAEQLHDECNRAEAESARLTSIQDQLRAQIAAGELRQTEVETRRRELEEAIAARQSTLANLRLEARSQQAQIEILERMIAHYEGYGSGVTSIFGARDQIGGVIDTAANLIEGQSEYLRAIETALGEAAQYVVVESRPSAYTAIEFLKTHAHGRVTFIVKSELDVWTKDRKLARPGGFGGQLVPATDVIRVRPGYEKLADLLLGDVWIVQDREAAEKLIELAQGDLRVVTLDGEFYRARPLHEGGGTAQLPLLGRDADLQRLRQEDAEVTGRIHELEAEIQTLLDARAEIELAGRELVQELSELRNQMAETQIQSAGIGLSLRQAATALAELQAATEQGRLKLESLRTSLQELASNVSQLTADSANKAHFLNQQSATVESLEAEVGRLSQQIEDERLRSIRLATEVNSLEGNLRRIDELALELESQRDRRAAAIDLRVEEVAVLQKHIADLRAQFADRTRTREELKAEELSLTVRQGELTEKQAEFDQLVRSNRKSRDEVAEFNQRLLVNETELHARWEDVARQLKETYDIDVAVMVMPEPLADATFQELEAELADCRNKQQQIGMVNMLALEEYEREAERERFLRSQIEDLTRAKDDLKTTINRINTTARRMFVETYDKVKSNFQKVFAELFQGGEADLRMENEDDPLESPIEISARPRGKRFLNITQLSGGEKALTAISLLFAIYLVKPSPFCILDEVDAPLDDANVIRFLRMVRSFIGRTQFIIITHNKRTMEQCDRLYGVTMQQPGVSQIVSVDFEGKARRTELEVMKFAIDEAPADLNEEPAPATRATVPTSDLDALGAEFDEEPASTERALVTETADTATAEEAEEEYDDEFDDDDADDDDDDEDDT